MQRDSRKIINELQKAGFKIVSITVSHHKMRKDKQTVIIPHPKKDLPIGTVRSIYKQAGLLS